jgi:hypothetical protein
MNPWPIYSFMKINWLENNRIPTVKEINLAFPHKTAEEKEEGMIEFKLAYDRVFSKEEWSQDYVTMPLWFVKYVDDLMNKGA